MKNEKKFKVMVVDDEITSLNHICDIIRKRCPHFLVTETASNGAAAWEKIQEQQPDLLFADVMMPIMNGIQLVKKVREKYPEVLSVIVSGYDDFVYVKEAFSFQVCDYLLKPVRPSDIVELLIKMEQRLEGLIYDRKKQLLHDIINGSRSVGEEELKKFFSEEGYSCAVFRKNGLPSRFSRKLSDDIFSMPQEKIFVYGRDTLESLYLCPASLMDQGDFLQYFTDICKKNTDNSSFYTAVVYPEKVSAEEFEAVLKRLFRCLDENIRIGENQTLVFRENKEGFKEENKTIFLEQLEFYMKNKKFSNVKKELENLFKRWETEKRNQIWVEEKIHFMITFFAEKGYMEKPDYFLLEDFFAQAVSMKELGENIQTLFCPDKEEEKTSEGWKEIYEQIIFFLEKHLDEEISTKTLCEKFALSSASLSRIFRKYGKRSFSSSLTEMRMKKAKELMRANPQMLIRNVSKQVGYADQFYFSRVFRTYYGYSPMEFLEGKEDGF